TLADAIAYVQAALNVGLDIDDFAPQLSFFFNAHNDLLEEIAKYRAAGRLWARMMREAFQAGKALSLLLRVYAQTAGSSRTNSMDEALALQTEDAAQIALRTQQIIANETGVANTIDPVAGSYAIEH